MDRRWVTRQLALVAVCLLMFVLPMVGFAMHGSALRAALSDGFLVGYLVLVAVIALAEIVVPSRVIRWRGALLEGEPVATRRVSQAFDRVLLEGGATWRIRALGVVLLVVGSGVGVGVWWLVLRAST